MKSRTWCAYCGKEYPLDTVTNEQIGEHIRTCPDHPMRKLEEENTRLHSLLDAPPVSDEAERREMMADAETMQVLAFLGLPHAGPVCTVFPGSKILSWIAQVKTLILTPPAVTIKEIHEINCDIASWLSHPFMDADNPDKQLAKWLRAHNVRVVEKEGEDA